MFLKLINKVASKAPKSVYEKTLKKALSSDKTAIPEVVTSELLRFFKGEHSETPPSKAFELLLLKIPKISKKWVSLIKSLTILDLLLENNLKIDSIAEASLDTIITLGAFKQKKHLTQELVKSFVRYLREKAKIYLFQSVRLSFYKEMRSEIKNIAVEVVLFQPLHNLIYEIIEICEQGLLKFQIIQNIFEHFLAILHGFYLLQLDVFKSLSQKYFSFNLQKAREVRENCSEFLKNTQALIDFVNRHQFMKFQQIKTHEIELFQPKLQLLQSFDDYIAVLMRNQNESMKLELSSSNIDADGGAFDQNTDCNVIDSDRDHEIQRKQNILVSPITAHFMKKRKEKAWHNDKPKTPEKERQSLPEFNSPERLNQSTPRNQKFKFCEKNELFCQEIFNQFENHYSQTYRGSILELGNYEVQDFELQLKFSNLGKMFFRRQTMDLSENIEFIAMKPFKAQIFGEYKNFYSKDFDKKSYKKEDKKG